VEKSKQIQKEKIMKLKDLLKEAVAEISYKKSGLKHPEKADLDHDKEISSYEKKRGGAIEKSMKSEFKSQAPKKEGIKFGNEERPMKTIPSLSREEMMAMNPMNNVCKECGAPMMYEDRMCAECGWMSEGEEELYKKGDMVGDDYPGDDEYASLAASFIGGGSDSSANDAATDASDSGDGGVSEGMDHEVSMAKASLKNIISNASELLNKLGDEEIDIPAWVQDHITNADNYISQANDGYYEYETGENNEIPDEESLFEGKGVDKFGYTKNAQAAGPFRGAQGPMQQASGNLEEKKKPSAGLTKKQKSTIAKKAHAGKDVGKKGKGFADVEKKAKESGATNPKAVAAAAMWKGAAKRAHK
jgi:hypothetical protein